MIKNIADDINVTKTLKTEFPLRYKLALTLISLMMLISAFSGIFLYTRASDYIFEEVRSRIQAIATTGSLIVDAEKLNRIRNSNDMNGNDYKSIKSMLVKIRDINPLLEDVYLLRKSKDPNTTTFIVDAPLDDEDISLTGENLDVSSMPELKVGFIRTSADKQLTPDKWGNWLSGYAPIKDGYGNKIALLGVDMSANNLIHEQQILKNIAIICLSIAFIMACTLSLLLTRKFMNIVGAFSEAATAVSNGDLDLSLEIHRNDEIGRFAATFNSMIQNLREARDTLIKATVRDMLTGLYNHRYFHENLEREIEHSKRNNNEMVVVIFDLDRFKSINDTLGHPVGDSILRQLANVITQNMRSTDIIARYGGDEFAAILPNTTLEEALDVSERLRGAVESHGFIANTENENDANTVSIKNKVISATITIGIAVYPLHHTTKDGLLMAADIALCRAKHLSRNSVGAYSTSDAGEHQLDPQELYQILHNPNTAAIKSLAAAVDAKDKYTCGHSERVATYAVEIARSMGFDSDNINLLKVAGMLHDLGKIGVPDNVLNKPGALSKEERASIQQHPSVGESILRRAPQLDALLPAILFHHERWDGTGYPNGLAGIEIPLIARIMAVADSFDAMTSDRPYRKAMTVEAAMLELKANAGTQFDPDIVDAFIENTGGFQQQIAA